VRFVLKKGCWSLLLKLKNVPGVTTAMTVATPARGTL